MSNSIIKKAHRLFAGTLDDMPAMLRETLGDCTCTPWVHPIFDPFGQITEVEVAHDDWCHRIVTAPK